MTAERVAVKTPALTHARRRGFGLDSPLPADPRIVEAQILRLLRNGSPEVIVVRPSRAPDHAPKAGHRPVPAFLDGTPDLLLLAPGGRVACLKIRTQAIPLSRAEQAFAGLCRQHAIPFAAVRSLAEAHAALARFGMPLGETP